MPRQIRFLLLVLCAGSLSGQLSERFTAVVNVGYGLVNSFSGSVNAITTDTAGNVYVLSDVESNPANNEIMFGSDIRVTKLDSAGNVIFSEQFGGSDSEHGAAVTTDKSGAVYVAGTTA